MRLIINDDRTVDIINNFGTNQDNKSEIIEFLFPRMICNKSIYDYNAYLVLDIDEENNRIPIDVNSYYEVSNKIASLISVTASIALIEKSQLSNISDKIVFSTLPFTLNFNKTIQIKEDFDDSPIIVDVLNTLLTKIGDIKQDILDNYYNKTAINDLLDGKVSVRDDADLMTNEQSEKLEGIEEGADVNLIESISVNNATQQIDQNKNVNITVPTKTSDLENDDNVVKDPNYQHITIDDDLDGNSTNPLQNKKIVSELNKKLNSSIANVFFKDIQYNASTGIFTFIKYDNTQITVDLPIETTVKSGRYDAVTHKLILVLMSDDTIEIPIADLVDIYTGDTNTQIQVVVKSGNIIEAILRKGSITEEYLDSNLVEKVNDNRNIAFATFDIDLETGNLIMYTNKQMDLEFRLSQETGNMEVLI